MKYVISLKKEGTVTLRSKPRPKEGRRVVQQSMLRSENLEADLAALFEQVRPESGQSG